MPINGIQRAPRPMAQQAAPNTPQAKPARANAIQQLVAVFNQPATPAKPLRRVAAVINPQLIRPMHERMEMRAVEKCQAQLRLMEQDRPQKAAAPAPPDARRIPAQKPVAPPARAPQRAAQPNQRQAVPGGHQAKSIAWPAPQPQHGPSPHPATRAVAKPKKPKGNAKSNHSPLAQALVALHVKRHLKALKEAKPNSQGYRRLTAKGKADSNGVRQKWVFYIHKNVHRHAYEKPDKQNQFITRAEVGPAMAPDKKTAGGYKFIEHRQGGMITLAAKYPGANLAADVTVPPDKYAEFANFIPTVVVDRQKAIARDGGPLLRTLTRQGTRLPLSAFETLVSQMGKLHERGMAHGDFKPVNLVLHPQKGVCAIDTDGMAYMRKNDRVVCTPGYMPDTLISDIMGGVASAYKTADEYAMLLSIIESTQPLKEARDPDFAQGYQDIFAEYAADRSAVYNAKTGKMIDRWLERHVKPQYRPYARDLLAHPLEYSEKRDSELYPALARILFNR